MNGGPAAGRLESMIGVVLRIGTVASAACFTVGIIMTLTGLGGDIAPAVLTAGLLLLLATPVARVTVSLVEFAREADWIFVILTLAVLLALAASVVAAYR